MNWDEYFLLVARAVSAKSKDPTTPVGALVVDPRTQRILATGFNGFPRGILDDERLDNREEKWAHTVHAEANALYGLLDRQTRGATMYVTLMPCPHCSLLLINFGVRRVVVPANSRRRMWNQTTRDLFEEAGVRIHLIEEVEMPECP